MPRKKGSPYKLELTGRKFGKWTVLNRIAGSMWLCQCECGTRNAVAANMMKLGKSTQCKSCASTKHGMEGTKIYNVWAGMKQRCQNPNYHGYQYYGARGITVCCDWQQFETFYTDMGDAPNGRSLGRKNNEQGYSKENCRWETATQQMRNRSTTIFLDFNGERKPLSEWAEQFGVAVKIAGVRFRQGWTVKQILLTPFRHRPIKETS